MPVDRSHWADTLFNARYGMGVNDRVDFDLKGAGPTNRPGQTPDERQAENSAYLFGVNYPNAAPFVQPVVNTFLSPPGTDFAARDRGSAAAQTGPLPTPPTPRLFDPDTSLGFGDDASVDVGPETFRVDPTTVNPAVPTPQPFYIPSFMAPTLPVDPPSSFDGGFYDFMSDRGGNTAGTSALDPFAGGDPFGDPLFGSVTPDGSPIEPVGSQPGQGNPDTGTAGGNLPKGFDPEFTPTNTAGSGLFTGTSSNPYNSPGFGASRGSDFGIFPDPNYETDSMSGDPYEGFFDYTDENGVFHPASGG